VILPLVDVAAVLDPRLSTTAPDHAEETVQVVVYARGESPVGLIVGGILDIVEEDGDVHGEPSRPGVSRTTVIQGRVTEMLDVDALLQAGK
jgi:two-component system chemotaxis sensor kinase CheA